MTEFGRKFTGIRCKIDENTNRRRLRMKLKQLLNGLDILELQADEAMEITGLFCDSRQAVPGSLFVAISGYESDGHRYIPAAADKGAAVCVCEKRPEGALPYVLVADSRRALAQLSSNYYGDPSREMTMIALTGTSGKTTSTMLIKHVLEQQPGLKVGLIGTNQNMIGDRILPAERTTPESIELQELFRLMKDGGCSHVVMEVSSHSLVLERVAGIDYAVSAYTNLSRDHLDFHETMEEYARSKALLFEKQSRAAVINLDDDWAEYMIGRANCPVMTYSTRDGAADLFADNIVLKAAGVSYDLRYKGEVYPISLGIPGLFSVYNSLDVIGCCLQLGLSPEAIAEALATAPGVKGRVEVVPTDGDYTILIDYSHKPDALEKVLKTLRAVTEGRLVALFGCGGDRDRTKRPIMASVAAELADFVIVTSDNPRTEDPQAIIDEILPGLAGYDTPHAAICDRAEAIRYAIDNHRPGDVILLAGKGHETYQEINHQKLHMDEREIVAEHLAARAAR